MNDPRYEMIIGRGEEDESFVPEVPELSGLAGTGGVVAP